jgi:hypothetical protein
VKFLMRQRCPSLKSLITLSPATALSLDLIHSSCACLQRSCHAPKLIVASISINDAINNKQPTMPATVYLITGGCRSGTSSYAQTLCEKLSPHPIYLATSSSSGEYRQGIQVTLRIQHCCSWSDDSKGTFIRCGGD